jgi:hypothetical protein
MALSLVQLFGLQLRAIEVLELEWYAQKYGQEAEAQLKGSIASDRVASPGTDDIPGRKGKAEAEDASSRTDDPSDSDPEESD